MELRTEDVPIYSEHAAQTFARDMVEVRARVDGFIEKRYFEVGSMVKAGQLLYRLDVRPYRAEVAKARGDLAQSEANLDFAKRQVALAQAEADLAQSEANLLKARNDVNRLRPLVEQDAAPASSHSTMRLRRWRQARQMWTPGARTSSRYACRPRRK
ncbi:MAG: biotin/lipoyl-binding protein [Bryobacterales bacterium]